jgi:hypothetical protein
MSVEGFTRVWMSGLAAVAIGLSAGTGAQQAPAEKPSCKWNQEEVDGKCVPKKPNDTAQATSEDPPPATNRPHERIPRCKEHEVLKDGRCVPDTDH